MNIFRKANPFKMDETEEKCLNLLVFFLCVFLFYAKNDFLKSNQWLSSRITEAEYFEHENLKFIQLLLQSHLSFGLICTEKLRKFKVKGFRGYLYLGADTIIWVDTSRHYVSLICFFFWMPIEANANFANVDAKIYRNLQTRLLSCFS